MKPAPYTTIANNPTDVYGVFRYADCVIFYGRRSLGEFGLVYLSLTGAKS